MKQNTGVWIDHRQAIIVTASEEGETITRIPSRLEKQTLRPFEHARAADEGPEDLRDRAFKGRLNRFYDAVISRLGDAPLLLIAGPGVAKKELKARLESTPFPGRRIVLESMDKMTDRQIAANVRRHFFG